LTHQEDLLKETRACIIGIGETRYLKRGAHGRSELSLACEAIRSAASDAGISIDEIDGFASYANDSSDPMLLSETLGLQRLRHASMVWGGGGGGAYAAIGNAATAVESGRARHVCVVRSLAQTPGHRYSEGYGFPHSYNFHRPFGMISPAAVVAPVARVYLETFGISSEEVAQVPLAFRDNAQRNPRAVMCGRPMSLDDYLGSRLVAEPLRLLDCCQESDGACAVIVSCNASASASAAPVPILAQAEGNDPGWGTGSGGHNMPTSAYLNSSGREMAVDLFAQAGLRPQDISTAQIYDHFAPFVLVYLEMFGFCKPGHAGRFVAEGSIAKGGALPLNTSGGHLSEGYMHGLNLALEGVRQMRGASTSQVAGASTCLVGGGSSALILGQ